MGPIQRDAGVRKQPPDASGPAGRRGSRPVLTARAEDSQPDLTLPAAAPLLPGSDPLSLPWQAVSLCCSCMACRGWGRRLQDDPLTAKSQPGSLDPASPSAPTVSLQTLATYLTTGYWQEAGFSTSRFNLGSSGLAAKSGTLSFNLSGWARDRNGLSVERQALAREVFKVYEAVLGIRFEEVSGWDDGDLRFTDNDIGAYSYMGDGWYDDSSMASITLDYSVVNIASGWHGGRSGFNTYVPQTFFHEIAHALGLGHQGQYNYTGAPLTYDSAAQFANDSWQVTMMSYWSQSAPPDSEASFAWLQTPMAVDWIALNDLYGPQGYGIANAFLGDTVYGIGTTISAEQSRIWNAFSTWAGLTAYTLVDGGGNDTLDVSSFQVDQLINLAASQLEATVPSLSNIGGKIGNLSIAPGTLIEAAIGGAGHDSFLGNEAANTFRGGEGNDRFWDSPGSDTYIGDGGSDQLWFSDPFDQVQLEIDGDSLLLTRLNGSVDRERIWNSLEQLTFQDVTYTYQQLCDLLLLDPLPDITISSINGLVSGAVTASTSLRFSGTLNAPLSATQTIVIQCQGLPLATLPPLPEGSTSWAFTLPEPLGSDAFTTTTAIYTALVIDAASGRQGRPSAPFQLTLDRESPRIGVDPLVSQDTTPLLSGTINDPTAQISIRIGVFSRAAVNHGDGRWSLAWDSPLATAQRYDVVATASDAAGNCGNDSTLSELTLVADDVPAEGSSGSVIAAGSSRTGVLELRGDRDRFAVDLEAGRTYQFRMDGLSLADPLLTLYSGTVALARHDDLSLINTNALITYTATRSGRHELEAAAYGDSGAGNYAVSVADVTPEISDLTLYFSLATGIAIPSPALLDGLTAQPNDILAFDGQAFSIWLDGDANGLAGAALRDFQIVNSEEVVVAFQAPVSLAGIAFDDSDLAWIRRTASGISIAMLFDGSDVGLTTAAEAIDAVTGLADGSWLLSTRGAAAVSGVGSVAAEDLLRFSPFSLGSATAGRWTLHADLSDVGFSGLSENTTAVDVLADGRIALVTAGTVNARGRGGTVLAAANEDVGLFQPSRLGSGTSGSFPTSLLFDGSLHGLGSQALSGLDLLL